MELHTQAAAEVPSPGWALIVDDHPLFCDALELTLSSMPAFARVRTAGALKEALALTDDGPPPALIVLDLNLPDVTGLDGLIRLRAALPDSPVIVASSLADNAMIGATLKAGASGFVPKHSPRAVFQSAFAAIRAGEVFTPVGYVAGDTPAPSALDRLTTLTNQQGRILELICDGKLNKQIAYDLSIAETTVKAHVTAIMRKLGVQSRTQAVLVAQEAKFANILPSAEP
ncbi:MAG: response regulator transcription factor [Pseudomonadota bacterium]